jgi:hypothetical protein
MIEPTKKDTASNPRYHFIETDDATYTGYSDYDPRVGPVYVVESDESDDAWIQSTAPVSVER